MEAIYDDSDEECECNENGICDGLCILNCQCVLHKMTKGACRHKIVSGFKNKFLPTDYGM